MLDIDSAFSWRGRLPRPLAAACLVSLSLMCAPARAEPSVPWTPSLAGRHAIHLLVDEAGLDLTTSQWPLPRAAVLHALDALPRALSPPLDAARALLKQELQDQAAGRLSLTVRPRAEALTGFGDEATPGSSVALRSPIFSGSLSGKFSSAAVALQVGGRVQQANSTDRTGTQFRLDDSAFVTEAFGVQLQFGSHRSWWSPGWQTALALSNNAPAFNGIGLQRASASTSTSPWLAWLGPWNFDVFIAQADGVAQPANPFFIGNRLTLKPFSNLELALTRTAQWGGRGRHASLGSLARLLVGSNTNVDVSQAVLDPGNQMSGFDARLRCPGGWRCAGYAQLIGEDEAGFVPSKYLGMYGLEIWSADGASRVFAELAETGCRSPIGREPVRACAYRNYAYPEGYVSAGRWIGASAGPDSRVLTLGWIDAAGDTSLKLSGGRIGSRIGSFSTLPDDPRHSGRMLGVSARHGMHFGAVTLTPELDWTRIRAPYGDRIEARIGANMTVGLDGAFERASTTLGDSLSSTSTSPWTQAMLATGLVAGSALLDPTVDRYAQHHGSNPSAKALRKVGDLLPFAAFGAAGLSWVMQRGSTQGDVAWAAAGAGVSAVAAAEVIKFAVDRSRPRDNLGATSFGDTPRLRSAFPSGHSTLVWAVVTPYAKQFDAPWLYGVAAVTNAARVMGRAHWFSDTVGGALLGYWVGDRFYQASVAAGAKPAAGKLSWAVSPRSVTLQVPFD